MSRGHPCRAAVLSRLRSCALYVAVAAWWGCALVAALVGVVVALFTPGQWLVSVSVLSGMLGTTAAIQLARWRDTALSTHLVVRSVSGCGLCLVVLVGLNRLLGQGVAPVVAALALTGIPVALSIARAHGVRTPSVPRRTPDAATVRQALELNVRRASLPVLYRSWQVTEECVTSTNDPYELGILTDVRARYLDELERRDPHGFADWLHADARPLSGPRSVLTPAPMPGRRTRPRH